ncbi:MAG: 3-deoxy-D-manno-octulosonic acid transferase [Flavobacteriaceae bacterium]|nr:3-deoxy-D-manno-octulosonic acid transferase [Flavobacteriaceae bacterium]
MHFLYNFFISISSLFIWLSQFFNPKMKLFVKGRKSVFKTLKSQIKPEDKTIWFHCASLGEYEQGVPIMEATKKVYPNHKLVVSFFSPSGFEVKKDNSVGDITVYLPLDTPKNANKFIKLVHPSLAIFVKYEFWPNYLFQLKKSNIPTFLVSGLFRENQIFFKSYGSFMRSALRTIHHFFVQDEASKTLLESINIENVSISGDTRFDRVYNQLKQDNTLDFIADFKQDKICVVLGSTWPEDDSILLEYINTSSDKVKFIIAPHEVKPARIEDLKMNIEKNTVLFSEKKGKNLADYKVFIIDTVGILTKIYSYADVAYVGGAMGKTGLHNILEPATFGVPIVIGQHFENFPEAKKLQELKGLFSVKMALGCSAILFKLVNDDDFRKKSGLIAEKYIQDNLGATEKVMDYTEDNL